MTTTLLANIVPAACWCQNLQKAAAKKAAKVEAASQARRTIPEFSASNIDDAIDLLSLSDDKKGPINPKDVDRHPERRFKAALAAFEER